MKTRTGAHHGRDGGRLSAGVRNARALKAAPKVTPVAVLSNAIGKRKVQDEVRGTCTELLSHSAKAAASAIASAAGVPPEIAKLVEAGALAAVAATHQLLPAASTGSERQHLPLPSLLQTPTPTPVKPVGRAGASTDHVQSASAAPSTSLIGHKRGTLIVIKPKTSYQRNKGARRLFDFEGICDFGGPVYI